MTSAAISSVIKLKNTNINIKLCMHTSLFLPLSAHLSKSLLLALVHYIERTGNMVSLEIQHFRVTSDFKDEAERVQRPEEEKVMRS